MENSNLIIRIPEPCHEDWNKMLPDEKGKFCLSCNKSVYDFSNKTDTQIKDILMANKDQKVCGHFKKTQIDRPLNIKIDLNNLPKNMSITKMFTLALFITFGTFLFSCTDNLGKTVGEISIVDPFKTENIENVQMLGQAVATPPDTLQAIEKVEKLNQVDMIDGEVAVMRETHVAGGISMQEVMYNETLPTIDSPIVEQPKIDEMIVGSMVYIPQVPDSVFEDKKVDEIVIDKKLNDENVKEVVIDFVVFPNPTNGEFTVKYDLKKRSDVLIEIIDINGIKLKTVVDIQGQHNGKYQVPVNLSDLNNGIYFVNLTNNGNRKTQKVILEK